MGGVSCVFLSFDQKSVSAASNSTAAQTSLLQHYSVNYCRVPSRWLKPSPKQGWSRIL